MVGGIIHGEAHFVFCPHTENMSSMGRRLGGAIQVSAYACVFRHYNTRSHARARIDKMLRNEEMKKIERDFHKR